MRWKQQRKSARRLAWAAVATSALVVPPQPAAAQEGQDDPASAEVTFTKDMVPILQQKCQNCHRPGALAPMSLVTYDEVRPWARSIKHRTGLRDKPDAMPPWFIERDIGIQQFRDDFSLSEDEIAKIAAWVDSGAPRGNPADMPPPRVFADAGEWLLGEPDLIVSSPSFEMPAQSPDWWGPIGTSSTGLTEDRYVSSVEVMEVAEPTEPEEAAPPGDWRTTGGRAIVHHLAWMPVSAEGRPLPEEDGGGIWPLHEVGRNPDVFDPEAGRLLKAGSSLMFVNAHLHAIGRHTKAHLDFGFRFHPRGYRPTQRFVGLNVDTRLLDIRGNEANQKFEGFLVLSEHTKLIAYEPHMHAAGVRMCLDAIWQNTAETLSCAGYNHGWVRTYNYADDAAPLLPKGTILRSTGYFDTTPANRNVADPRNWSGLGHRTMDNMSISILRAIHLTDEEFEEEMAKRRERLGFMDGQTVIGCPLCEYGKAVQPTAAAGQQ